MDDQVVRALDRIAKILAGILLRDIEDGQQNRKIQRLKQCGFSNVEIAKMLDTSGNTVNVALHALRKGRGRSKKKSRA